MAFGIYLLPLVVNAIESVPDIFLRTSYTLGATRFQVIRHVLIPIALALELAGIVARVCPSGACSADGGTSSR